MNPRARVGWRAAWSLQALALTLSIFGLDLEAARAFGLGKIKVDSHLNEPFIAEIPLRLEKGESIDHLSIGLASPAEYKTLEVYRDAAVGLLRLEIRNDSRGRHVRVFSVSALATPYFNLVLKIHSGHATFFKKFPVFLELPRVAPVTALKAANPPAGPQTTVQSAPSPAKVAAPSPVRNVPVPVRRYGPMTYGETIGAVAKKLRRDPRFRPFTLAQVMVALFRKNRGKFEHGNINLIKAGEYLQVPSAAEVKAVEPAAALALIKEHSRLWQRLRAPRGGEARAGGNRFQSHVRVGELAVGTGRAAAVAAKGRGGGAVKGRSNPPSAPTVAAIPEAHALRAGLEQLRAQNRDLRARLDADEKKLALLASKQVAGGMKRAAARLRKLELRMAHMQTELRQTRRQLQQARDGLWIVYVLVVLIIVLLVVIGYLLRRERPHPAAVPGRMSTAAADAGSGPASVTVGPDAAESQPSKAASKPSEPERADEAVKYLAEADVYLTYGMTEEAIHQLHRAIERYPGDEEAYCRLIRLLKGKGAEAELQELMTTARKALSGDALRKFEEAAMALETGQPPAGATTVPAEIEMPTSVESEDDVPDSGSSGLTKEKAMDLERLNQPGHLDVDKGRSLVAEGRLEEAEAAFQAAAEAGVQAAAIGLAEVAVRRGEHERAAELLAGVEAVVGDEHRGWLEAVSSEVQR